MDVLRHTGRAELASFLGGSNASADAGQWAFAPYTEADLEEQIKAMATEHGAAGKQAVEDLYSYVEGINAYIAAANLDTKLKPAEYSFINKPMEAWKPTDIVAIASLVGGIFGKGGGNELHSALTMEAMVERLGNKAGRKAWEGFRSKNDPEAPTTISKPYPYETRSAFAKKGLALPEPKQRVRNADRLRRVGDAGAAGLNTVGGRLTRGLEEAGHASNWELVSKKNSADGHPIAVMGPQVGYYVPQILMEEDLHGPGIDARGAAFPGVNLYVELGHGRDYAWSATTATSDNVDTFAEVLCKDKFHYLYKGKCLAMEKLSKTESWAPNTIDPTTAGSQTLIAYRTVHGIVFARGKSDGKKVAFVHARSTYFHEADSVIGFGQLNEPGVVTGVKGFKKAVSDINFLFNWSYVDANHIAYALSGAMPQRARGTSPDFPILGTGKYDWQGYEPKTHDAEWLPFAKHPQAVDPAYLVSWNNKQAPEWAAADDKYDYGPVFRSQMIEDHIKNDIKGNKKMTIAQLVQAMEEPATRGSARRQGAAAADQGDRHAEVGRLKTALAELKAWHAHGSHRRDLDRNGEYEENRAVELMDAWWPKLVEAEFKPALGPKAYEALEGMLETGSYTGGSPTEPSSTTAGSATSRRTCATSSGRPRRRPGAAATAAKGRRRSARRCSKRASRKRSRRPRRNCTAAETAPARPTRSRPASTPTVRTKPAASNWALPVPEPPDLPAGRDPDPEAGEVGVRRFAGDWRRDDVSAERRHWGDGTLRGRGGTGDTGSVTGGAARPRPRLRDRPASTPTYMRGESRNTSPGAQVAQLSGVSPRVDATFP